MPAPDGHWKQELARCFTATAKPVHFVGIGNPLRSDDGAGPAAVSLLRRALGRASPRWVVLHKETNPERGVARIPSKEGIMLFDTVQSHSPPGTIVCTTLADTRYGFFATHNVPLRLLPGLSDRADSVFVVGVEPESLEVGEGLTKTVRESVDALVNGVADLVRNNP